jgi:hypothetical protein
VTVQAQDPRQPREALTPVSSGTARQSRTSGRGNKTTWRLVGLAVLAHMLRSRRFYENVAFAAIVLAALSGLSQENRARAFGRLIAWNKQQIRLLERKAEREAERLERKARLKA